MRRCAIVVCASVSIALGVAGAQTSSLVGWVTSDSANVQPVANAEIAIVALNKVTRATAAELVAPIDGLASVAGRLTPKPRSWRV